MKGITTLIVVSIFAATPAIGLELDVLPQLKDSDLTDFVGDELKKFLEEARKQAEKEVEERTKQERKAQEQTKKVLKEAEKRQRERKKRAEKVLKEEKKHAKKRAKKKAATEEDVSKQKNEDTNRVTSSIEESGTTIEAEGTSDLTVDRVEAVEKLTDALMLEFEELLREGQVSSP